MSDLRTPQASGAAAVLELEAGDLPAFCPNRKMPVWSQHPRVFLDVVQANRIAAVWNVDADLFD